MLAYLIILQLASVCLVRALEPSSMVPKKCIRRDTSAAATLDRVCEDCYNLYREPLIYTESRKRCFNNRYFEACIEALMYNDDEKENIMRKIVFLNGGSMSAKISYLGAPKDCKNYHPKFYATLNSTCYNCHENCGGGEIYNNCKKNCFVNEYFDGCLKNFVKRKRRGALMFRRDFFNGRRINLTETEMNSKMNQQGMSCRRKSSSAPEGEPIDPILLEGIDPETPEEESIEPKPREGKSIELEDCKNYVPGLYDGLDSACRKCQGNDGMDEIYTNCRSNCFGNGLFDECLETFEVSEAKELRDMRDKLNGVEVPDEESYPPNDCKNYDRQIYDDLIFSCHKCQERGRRDGIYDYCKSNCFVNGFFDYCIENFEKKKVTALRRNRDYLNGELTPTPET